MSGAKTLDELRTEHEALRATNPFIAARFAIANGLHDVPSTPAAAPAAVKPELTDAEVIAIVAAGGTVENITDADVRARIAAHQTKATHAELKKTNPFIAARYAAANGLHK